MIKKKINILYYYYELLKIVPEENENVQLRLLEIYKKLLTKENRRNPIEIKIFHEWWMNYYAFSSYENYPPNKNVFISPIFYLGHFENNPKFSTAVKLFAETELNKLTKILSDEAKKQEEENKEKRKEFEEKI